MNDIEVKNKVDKLLREENNANEFFFFTYTTWRLEEKSKCEVKLNKSIFVILFQIYPKFQLFFTVNGQTLFPPYF